MFGINIVALKAGQPQLLNLKQFLMAFIQHRREVVTRRTRYFKEVYGRTQRTGPNTLIVLRMGGSTTLIISP